MYIPIVSDLFKEIKDSAERREDRQRWDRLDHEMAMDPYYGPQLRSMGYDYPITKTFDNCCYINTCDETQTCSMSLDPELTKEEKELWQKHCRKAKKLSGISQNDLLIKDGDININDIPSYEKIIDKKRYSTKNSILLAYDTFIHHRSSSISYTCLYKTKNGRFFEYGVNFYKHKQCYEDMHLTAVDEEEASNFIERRRLFKDGQVLLSIARSNEESGIEDA